MSMCVCVKKCFVNRRLYAPGETVPYTPSLPKDYFRLLDGKRETAIAAQKEIEDIKKEESKVPRSAVQEERRKQAHERKPKEPKAVDTKAKGDILE